MGVVVYLESKKKEIANQKNVSQKDVKKHVNGTSYDFNTVMKKNEKNSERIKKKREQSNKVVLKVYKIK
jgi:predicted phage-related endonuclease